MITICIGFDDHVSVYDVSTLKAEDLQGMDDVEDIVDHIVEHGYRYEVADANNLGEVFLDVTRNSAEDFLDQLATALAEESAF